MRGAVLVLLLLAPLVAQAEGLRVAKHPVEAFHAERLDLPERFAFVQTATLQAPLDVPALAPVELGESLPPGGPGVRAGHWTYEVVLRERAPDAVREGTFVLALLRDGVSLGETTLVQNVSDPLLAEGARILFDLGARPPEGSLLLMTLREVRGPDVTLRSAFEVDYVWRAQGGAKDGERNPPLDATRGRAFVFRIVNGDGTTEHDLRVVDARRKPVSGKAQDAGPGEESTLAWTPAATGTFRYECRYHPTMGGAITVTEESA